ncbi:MAG: amylo-alpha-1,6-glucosidase [Thermoplasmata archaeon]
MKENEIFKEWIITNKNGSYSSSTVSFANTRTYHGILVKKISENYDRFVLLSKFFEKIKKDGEKFFIDTNFYPNVIYPEGFKYIENFKVFPIPEFDYRINELKIKKIILLDTYFDTVFIKYEFIGEIPDEIDLFPLLSFRSNHTVIRKGMRSFNLNISDIVTFSLNDLFINFKVPGKFIKNEDWYYNFQYVIDKERGSNYEEDLFNPGYFALENPPRKFVVKISSDKIKNNDFNSAKATYLKYLEKNSTKLLKKISMASNFLITNDDIIAGYYWFGPWARDAFISIPGLFLVKKKFEEAKRILLKYGKSMKNGIIPKNLEKGDEITVDTSLWYIYAIYKYYEYTKNKNDLITFYPYVKEIVDSYIKGNDKFSLDNNFIRIRDSPLTWMDANYGNVSVTPRIGLPVEVNALWYNAISCIEYFENELGLKTEPGLYDIKKSLEDNFLDKFLSNGRILDVADPDDSSIRPNFIFAFSLPFAIMHNFRDFKKIVDDELLTPYGLRTLSPKDQKFKSNYEGNWEMRDMAYHNGSVWPWLVGPYITASIKCGENPKKLLEYFKPLYNMIYLPEIFDGLNPSEPKGCIIQAWSYGEILRSYYEDIFPKMIK